jgi:hypothetical protein
MTDRLNAPWFAGLPSAVASTDGVSNVFAGVATIASGTAAVTVTGVDVTSDAAIFLGTMTHSFSVVVSGFTSRALTVASLTTNTGSPAAVGGFTITTQGVLAVSSVSQVKVPWMVWSIR